jgi:hypothetical protein
LGFAIALPNLLNWVRIDLEEDDVSHLEPDDQKYHRIMARQ